MDLFAQPYTQLWRAIEAAGKGTDGFTPQQAYRMYEEFLLENGLDPTIYLSMAITSGGYARKEGLGVVDIITLNSSYGWMTKAAILFQYPEFSPRDVILPSELG